MEAAAPLFYMILATILAIMGIRALVVPASRLEGKRNALPVAVVRGIGVALLASAALFIIYGLLVAIPAATNRL